MKKNYDTPTNKQSNPYDVEKYHKGKRPGWKAKASDHRKSGQIRIKC